MRKSAFLLALLAGAAPVAAAHAQSAASPFTSAQRFDEMRRVTGTISPDPDGSGSLPFRATRNTYDAAGRLTKVERGSLSSWQSDSVAPLDWGSAFSALEVTEVAYDAMGRKTKETLSDGTTPHALTQYSYDGDGRLECTARRMNQAIFPTITTHACTLGTEGSFGPDRIVKNHYDAAGQLTKVQEALGTSIQADEVTNSYTNNGRLATLTDGEGNKTSYDYDGHDRLLNTRYPSPTTDGVSAPISGTGADFEQFAYDAGSNVTGRKIRGDENASVIVFTFDALNRMTFKNLPGSEPDVTYTYDLAGQMTGASQSGHALTFTFDKAGRPLTQAGPQGTVTTGWDSAGRRTRLTYPGSGLYVDYDYLVTGEVTAIRENGATSGVGVLATFGYDNLGRRTSLTRGNGTSTSYTFDAGSRLASLVDNPAGTTHDLTLGFSYNPASEITQNTRSNDAFSFAPSNVTRTDTYNGLNQLTAIGATSLTHDTRGNITYDGTKTFGYSSENLLTSATGSVSLAYDPMLRLYQTIGAAATRFAYDGAHMIAEYNGSNALQRRFVHGSGTDEPLVWYEGTGTTDRRFLHADERGSIVAISNGSGTVTNVNTYDEYGAPATGNTGRFQYTGQKWIGELGLYDYKARMYNPFLPRFMQTDPIGYGDGTNLYGYVGGNPVNAIDPQGETAYKCTITIIDGSASTECIPTDDGKSEVTVTGTIVRVTTNADGSKTTTRQGFTGSVPWRISNMLASDQTKLGWILYKATGLRSNFEPFTPMVGPGNYPSTGRTEPRNLRESLVLREVRSNPGAGQPVDLKNGMSDRRFPAGSVKLRQRINGVEVHYVRTPGGRYVDFKFK